MMKRQYILIVIILGIILSSGCVTPETSQRTRNIYTQMFANALNSTDLYASFGTKPPDMSLYSKCEGPLTVDIVNDEKREFDDSVLLVNPMRMTDHLINYMTDALEKSNVRKDKSSKKIMKISMQKFDSPPGFTRTTIVAIQVQIPEINFNKVYTVKEYSGDFFKATANAIHVITWKVINDIAVKDYITCADRTIHNKSSVGEKALDILKRRYASGEITKEQFEQMKKDIQ